MLGRLQARYWGFKPHISRRNSAGEYYGAAAPSTLPALLSPPIRDCSVVSSITYKTTEHWNKVTFDPLIKLSGT